MGPLGLKRGEEMNSKVFEFPTCGLRYRLSETFECCPKQSLLLFSIQNILSFLKLSESTKAPYYFKIL